MEHDGEQIPVIISPASDPDSGPIVTATMGRVMTTLLSARARKLQLAISRLQNPPSLTPLTFSLEQSLWFLHKYVGEAAEKREHLDQVLVPIIQHSLTMKESNQGNQHIILLNWMFQDEVLFQAVMSNLVGIILRKGDHHVALGWCIIGRRIIEYEDILNNVETGGIKEKYFAILKMLCSPVNHLLSIVCNGSIMQEGFELPTRLAIAAADFILCLTVELTRWVPTSKNMVIRQTLSTVKAHNHPATLSPTSANDIDGNIPRKASDVTSTIELKLLLLNHINELLTLVNKLTAWSRKSRFLHAKGLDRLSKWLEEIKRHYGFLQDETESQLLKTGSLLLASCWKHYGMLLHLYDLKFYQRYKEQLDQYLSGIQFYADDQDEEANTGRDNRAETSKFFLNCIMLLLGRLDNHQFENAITEFGPRILQVLMSQLRCADEEVIDTAILLLKALIFRTNNSLSETSLCDVKPMDTLLPVLLNLLDEQDAAAKAVVKLVAEYFSICPDSDCLHEVVKRIASENVVQRRNALDIITDLIHSSRVSTDVLTPVVWEDVTSHLLNCLGDEDQIIQSQAASVVPIIDPPLVLPALVNLCYSINEKVQLSACNALIALIINHKEDPEVILMLLDCLRKLCQKSDSGTPSDSKRGSTLDADTVLILLSEWAKNVQNWNILVGPFVEKMLANPSDAVFVRFLSSISEYLAEAVDIVFERLLFFMREQDEKDESLWDSERRKDSNIEALEHEHCLFSHLCPLLVIKLLPLKVFDDLNSRLVYGELQICTDLFDGHFNSEGTGCIVSLMAKRAFNISGFEDVRKLAAELCGRILPEVLIPILSFQLESAYNSKDPWKIKAFLFSLCTCLMIRVNAAYKHPDFFKIRQTIQKILSWQSVDNDEISKVQHGCIDCLALMLCAELQDPGLSKGIIRASDSGPGSVLAYVMNQLIDKKEISFACEGRVPVAESASSISYRICMANVLISACQKTSNSGKKQFVKRVVPRVIQSIQVLIEPDIRAACIQVLFSAVYHVKALIFPHANDLLRVALNSLREGFHKEKMAGAKLLASLMASEEEVVESISPSLLEARALLKNLEEDSSPELRHVCQQLFICLSPH